MVMAPSPKTKGSLPQRVPVAATLCSDDAALLTSCSDSVCQRTSDILCEKPTAAGGWYTARRAAAMPQAGSPQRLRSATHCHLERFS